MSTFQTLLALVVLIYVLCVIVQAVQEFIVKWWRDSKPATLRKTLATFIGKAAVPELEKVLESRGLDITALEGLSKDDFRQLLGAILNPESSLAGLVKSAQKKVDTAAGALDGIQAKFEAAYARHNKLWVLGLSAALVLVLNANLFFLYQDIAADQAMSQQIASTADKFVHAKGEAQGSAAGSASTQPQSANTPPVPQDVNKPRAQGDVPQPPQPGPQGQNQSAGGSGLCQQQQTTSTDVAGDYKQTRDCVKSLLTEYPTLVRWRPHHKALGGWVAQLKADAEDSGSKTFFGLVMMWLLVSLGAPFWNDVLKGMTGVNNRLNSNAKKLQ